MGSPPLNIVVLTSSRADYSIYYPLLKKLKEDKYFSLNLIVFGTHLSKGHGTTIKNIKKDGFEINHLVKTLIKTDNPAAISKNMAETIAKFAEIWEKESYGLLLALGDRYEMFAAVASSIPFNIDIAHIHGGETTLGAIDNVFRHSITLASKYHFCATEVYKNRIVNLIGKDENIYNVGALSLDNLYNQSLYSIEEFEKIFNIDLTKPSVLITFHPETVSYKKNEIFIEELISTFHEMKEFQLIITMPNADTKGNMIRKKLNNFVAITSNAIGIENFGTIGYLTCMKYCSFMLGNTSSGFVEASFFPKHVINIGDRQKGRLVTTNIINCSIKKGEILRSVKKIKEQPLLENINIYGDGCASNKIIEVLKML